MEDFTDDAPSIRLRENLVVVTPLEPDPEFYPGAPYDCEGNTADNTTMTYYSKDRS